MWTSHLRPIIVGVIATYVVVAFASNRMVSIPSDTTSKQLTLTNGSAVSVNYNLNCYENGTVSFSTSESLAAKQTTTWGGVSGSGNWCSTSTEYSFPGDVMFLCESSAYDTFTTMCGSDSHVCSMAEYRSYAAGDYSNAWVSTDGFTDPYGATYATDPWTTTANLTNNPPSVAASASSKCSYDTNQANEFTNCRGGTDSYTGSFYPVACCPNLSTGGPIDICDVTVTTSDGYLQSPQFQMNKPF